MKWKTILPLVVMILVLGGDLLTKKIAHTYFTHRVIFEHPETGAFLSGLLVYLSPNRITLAHDRGDFESLAQGTYLPSLQIASAPSDTFTSGIVVLVQKDYVAIQLDTPLSPALQKLYEEEYKGWSWLNVTMVYNKGAIFGSFSQIKPAALKQILFIAFSLLAMGVVFLFYRNLHPRVIFPKILVGMVVGGAVGNLFDRIFGYMLYEGECRMMYGKVVDWVDMGVGPPGETWSLFGLTDLSYRWPTYNVADAAILIAVILLIGYFYWFRHNPTIFVHGARNTQATLQDSSISKSSPSSNSEMDPPNQNWVDKNGEPS
jgi:signal peptidase II